MKTGSTERMRKKKKEKREMQRREKKRHTEEMRKGIKPRDKPRRRRGSLRFIGKHINSNSGSSGEPGEGRR